MKRKIFLFLFLLPLAVLAQPSPGSDTVWKKEIFPDYARSAFFSKDDSKLYVNTDRAVLIYEPLSGSLIHEVLGKGFFLFETPDGRFIFTDSLLKLDAVTYEVVGQLPLNNTQDRFRDLSMSGDGQVLMGSFQRFFLPDYTMAEKQENNIIFYNPATLKIIDSLTVRELVYKGKISPDNKYFSLITTGVVDKKTIRRMELYDFITKQIIDTLQSQYESFINDIGWSPDSKYLAVQTPADVFVYKFPEQERYTEFPRFPNDYIGVESFAFDRTSSYLATGGGMNEEANRLHIWDLTTKQLKYKYMKYKYVVSKYTTFSNNNKYIFTGGSRDFILFKTDTLITDFHEYEEHLSGTIYPNPVNNFALLTFQVEVPDEFNIKLYNSNGVFVQQIFNGFLEMGENTVNMDCSVLPSGVYYISINNKEFFKLIKEN